MKVTRPSNRLAKAAASTAALIRIHTSLTARQAVMGRISSMPRVTALLMDVAATLGRRL